MLLFFLIFAIIAVSEFKGRFYYCDTDEISYTVINVYTKWDCINNGAEWLNRNYSFDNTLQAMRALFQIACTTGWSDIMYSAIDASAVDYEPVKD